MAARTIYIIPSNNRAGIPSAKSPITIQRPILAATQPNIIRKAPLLSPRSTIGGTMISRQTAAVLPRHQPTFRSVPTPKPAPSATSMALKRPATEITLDEVVDLISPTNISHPAPPRKRERLTHLSMEEKLNRRKMKNRVAAQTARDRKKERVSKLEKALQLLLEENSKLRSDNRTLIAENQKLRREREQWQNSQMMVNTMNEGFGMGQAAQTSMCSTNPNSSSNGTFESAALISGPLPWERAPVKSEEGESSNNEECSASTSKLARTQSSSRLRSLLTIFALMMNCKRSSTTSSTTPKTRSTSIASAMKLLKRSSRTSTNNKSKHRSNIAAKRPRVRLRFQPPHRLNPKVPWDLPATPAMTTLSRRTSSSQPTMDIKVEPSSPRSMEQ